MTKPTKRHVRQAKTQISLGIRPVWSESSLSAWRKLGFLATHWTHSEGSDQTRRMPRLICVFAGRTCHIVGFVMRWLNYMIRTPTRPELMCWAQTISELTTRAGHSSTSTRFMPQKFCCSKPVFLLQLLLIYVCRFCENVVAYCNYRLGVCRISMFSTQTSNFKRPFLSNFCLIR